MSNSSAGRLIELTATVESASTRIDLSMCPGASDDSLRDEKFDLVVIDFDAVCVVTCCVVCRRVYL